MRKWRWLSYAGSPLALLVTVLVTLAMTLPLDPSMTFGQGGAEVQSVRIRLVARFSANRGGIVVRPGRVAVFEELDRSYDERTREFRHTPDEGEAKGWHGEEFRREEFSLNGEDFEEVRRSFVQRGEVPSDATETSHCDNENRASISVGSPVVRVLPAGSLIKAVLPVNAGDKRVLVVMYSTPSPADARDEFASYLAVIDETTNRLLGLMQVEEGVYFCSLRVGEFTGDNRPDVVVLGDSIGGSGYSMVASIFSLTPEAVQRK